MKKPLDSFFVLLSIENQMQYVTVHFNPATSSDHFLSSSVFLQQVFFPSLFAARMILIGPREKHSGCDRGRTDVLRYPS